MTVVPAAPVPLLSTLRLIANVKPDSFLMKIMWVAPSGIPMRSEGKQNLGVVAKLPRVQKDSSGAYVCMVRPWEASHKNLFPFDVKVAVDGENSGMDILFAGTDCRIGHLFQKLPQQHYLFKHPVATILQSVYFKRVFSKVYRRSLMKITLL